MVGDLLNLDSIFFIFQPIKSFHTRSEEVYKKEVFLKAQA